MAAVFTCLSFSTVSSRELPLEAWLTKAPQGGGGEGWARVSDGCPIHHGGPWRWAKEPTCGGEGEVVSEESALSDSSRSIIPTRAEQNLSVWWQPAEWLLPLWARSNVLTRRKWLWDGQSCWYHSEDLGNQHYQIEGFVAGPRVVC